MTEDCRPVDLLFVIDGSPSMADEQDELQAYLPAIVDAVIAAAPRAELRIGVTTTDPVENTRVTGCVTAWGNLVTAACDASPVHPTYYDGAEFDDNTLACLLGVGSEGGADERPIAAMLGAVDPDNPCNGGFLRPDSFLVVVLVSDEDDDDEAITCGVENDAGTPGQPDAWFEAVRAARGGDADGIGLLALIGPPGDASCLPAATPCYDNAAGVEPAPRLAAFAAKFAHGATHPICTDPSDALATVIAPLEDACETPAPNG